MISNHDRIFIAGHQPASLCQDRLNQGRFRWWGNESKLISGRLVCRNDLPTHRHPSFHTLYTGDRLRQRRNLIIAIGTIKGDIDIRKEIFFDVLHGLIKGTEEIHHSDEDCAAQDQRGQGQCQTCLPTESIPDRYPHRAWEDSRVFCLLYGLLYAAVPQPIIAECFPNRNPDRIPHWEQRRKGGDHKSHNCLLDSTLRKDGKSTRIKIKPGGHPIQDHGSQVRGQWHRNRKSDCAKSKDQSHIHRHDLARLAANGLHDPDLFDMLRH